MPTKIEAGYVEQGYKLPAQFIGGWGQVAELRARYDIDPIYVPVAGGYGTIAWGVPIAANGRFMRHEEE
jgi:hypothetical protein